MMQQEAPVEIQESMRNGQRFQIQRNDDWNYDQASLLLNGAFATSLQSTYEQSWRERKKELF